MDAQNCPLTSEVKEAVSSYNQGIAAFLEYRLSAMPFLKEAVSADPDFGMAHCMRGYLFMMFGTFSVLDAARSALKAAQLQTTRMNERERWHLEALRAWIDADLERASSVWEQILTDYPLDIIALRLHHFNSFWLGKTRALRAAPASVVDAWSDTLPGYGNVLGMLAFGYEENGEYAIAERYGRRAVEINPEDLWAVHAVGHVFEMQGRDKEGIAWLDGDVNRWDDRNPFKRHIWWHLALFHIEAASYEEALSIYDQCVQAGSSDFYLDIQNAASLLARLEFVGLDVRDRWRALADHAESHIDDHALVFTDIHCVMSLAHEKRFDAARALIKSLRAYSENENRTISPIIRSVGIPLCEAMLQFEKGDYDSAMATFVRLRHDNARVGASHAQRDIFDLYLIESAFRGLRLSVAGSLLRERNVIRPGNKK
ncbi:hypothetical protein R69658_06891 [Paraburkholderia aspalathi]|uniref:Tetratricopeptide repeat protein 38 n=1 Tax=Paraburkholderia aspalathi TaxID=1324617 RepID=A0ABN7N4Q7_9BURK|nr:tetratricopeptide repeat protein [Paraburkholderia aspalathi]MBK3823236.1 tetratricopeptide repeat protein [Paraburkholderia aspalathi]MBK3835086.1 tetratricopeptide repeat protein [Paraburkholderia aspalathi]MBK3864822.1 tetratricopeptide repeat protein [Paraburkholderia aspalathi]CAE6844825.1 hypothetical protein R69658_06891 [Paraburkholderia aspalathi]